MANFKKLFLSAAMLIGIGVVSGSLSTHAAADGLVENFDYSTDEITIGATSNYNIYSKTIVATELVQDDSLDVLKISHQPGELASTSGKIEFRDNGGASSLFNTPGSSVVIKIKFKMNQTEDKSFKLWFGGGDVNSSGKTYNLLRMRYNEFRYQMGTAKEEIVSGVVVSANTWHEAAFVLHETGPDTQDKVYTYVDNKLLYSADFNTGDDFNGKLTGFNIEWPKGNYSSASNMLIDYISVQEYNGATASIDETKEVKVGEEFSLSPLLTATIPNQDISLSDYSVSISDNTKLAYNQTSKKFTALSDTTDPVIVTFDFVDELIEDKTVKVTIKEATEPIKVASINQILIEGDINLSIKESFNLDHLFQANPSTAANTVLEYEVVSGNDIATIEDGVLTGVQAGTAKIQAKATDGSNVIKEVNVKVSNGAYADLNNYEIGNVWTEAEQTVNGFTSKGFNNYAFAQAGVVTDDIFGNVLVIRGNGGANSSGAHLDKHIPLSALSANKDYKFSGWIKVNPEALEKSSATTLDIKVFTYSVKNGVYSYGLKDTVYGAVKSTIKAQAKDWIYVETEPINLDINALGNAWQGLKIEMDLWKGEEGIEAHFTHLGLVECEGVRTSGWDITNSNNTVMDTSKELTLQVGSEFKINAVAIPSAGSIVAAFSSSDETVATVNADGLVTVLDKVGTAIITVKVGTETKEVRINVAKTAQSITMDSTTIEIILNKFDARRAIYDIVVSPADATSELEVVVADEKICKASILGKKLYITNPALGTSTITISAKDNPEAKVVITIVVKDYTVTYNVNGHGDTPEALINVTTLPTELPVLTAEGYVFEGWYTDAEFTTKAVAGSTITEDTTLYAKWVNKEDAKFTITFDVQGHGTAPAVLNNVTAIPSELPVLTAEGYVFGGWYTTADCTTKAVEGTALTTHTTLYAKWTEKVEESFTITYNTKGHGTAPDAVTGTKLPDNLPVLSEIGWTFEGWYLDENCTTEAKAGQSITADTTLYAKWTEKAVTPPTPNTPEEPTGLGAGAIAGIVIGVVATLGVAGGLAFYFLKKKQTPKQATKNEDKE